MPFKRFYYFGLSERFGPITSLTLTRKSFLPTSFLLLGHPSHFLLPPPNSGGGLRFPR